MPDRCGPKHSPRRQAPRGAAIVLIEISPGELFDRLTILQIKIEKIADPIRRTGLARSCAELEVAAKSLCDETVEHLVADLKNVNAALWRIEDELRAHEQRQEFGASFVDLARSVYFNNDRRSVLKRRIDEHLGSALTEEKSYPSYGAQRDR
jgi:hypothetical protein